ncbi:hypothetical protein Hanom_Chr01g00093381 [Helianthus anomalus]
MELTTQVKMARFQTFWIHMWENTPFDESRQTDQISGTKTGILLLMFFSLD